MKIAALADVKAHLSAYVDECANEGPVIITRNGKAAAVLLAPKDDDDLERLMLAHSRRLQSLLSKSRKSIKAGKGVSDYEFWKTVARRPRGQTPFTCPKTQIGFVNPSNRFASPYSLLYSLQVCNQKSRRNYLKAAACGRHNAAARTNAGAGG